MNSDNFTEKIKRSGDNAQILVTAVANDPSLIAVLLEGINSKEAAVKYKCIKTIKIISQQNPATVYPHIDVFIELLESSNNILKWNAIDIYANLVVIEPGGKLKSLGKILGKLAEGSLITAAHVVENSVKLVKARPEWENEITSALLGIEQIRLPTEECRNILRGKVMLAFAQYADRSKNKKQMLNFAEKQLNNRRPATQKKAEQFIKFISSSANRD
jgi:hypothetical protein